MILKHQQQIIYFHFHHLSRFHNLRHAVFTRTGGHSKPPYNDLNLALGVGDELEAVMHNRQTIAQVIHSPLRTAFDNPQDKPSRLVFINQVHGNDIITITADNDLTTQNQPQTGDAIITDCTNITLIIQAADCQAVMLFDPQRRVIAHVHSGWRGSVHNIIGNTVSRMKDVFGCRAQNILAGISPSLGPCCAEFIHYQQSLPAHFQRYRTTNYNFDFWSISRDQLLAQGLKSHHIEISYICTACNQHLFFSYRKQKITGRFAAAIQLTPS